MDQREAPARSPLDGRRDDIITTAARLFADKGYASITMTQIARACGLRQSSLYYWFGDKEAIVRELLALNRLTMDFIATRVADAAESPAVRLLRLLMFDLGQLCRAPVDITEIDALAERQPEGFPEYWADMQVLHGELAAIVTAGIERGEFTPCDPELAALRMCAAEHGVAHRCRFSAVHSPDGPSPFRHPGPRRSDLVSETAQWLVRALLADPATLPAVVAAAGQHADADARAAEELAAGPDVRLLPARPGPPRRPSPRRHSGAQGYAAIAFCRR
jgi:TetR/AcrR family transcriptional regulator